MDGGCFQVERISGLTLSVLILAGCNQSPYWGGPRSGIPAAPAYQAQVQDLNQRTSALDADNRDLHVELARAQQQARVLQDEVGLLRDQLAEKASDVRELAAAKAEADQRLQSVEAAARRRGGAMITANTSLSKKLPHLDLPGVEVREEAGTIRIELPADRLFQQQSDRLLPASQRWIDLVGNAIRDSYPRQRIGVEGHTDGSSLGSVSGHQLSAAQAMAVVQALRRSAGLSDRQLFVAGYGAGRPRVSNATPAGRAENRRIEIVIYPETIDDLAGR